MYIFGGFAFPAPFVEDPPHCLPAVTIPGAYNILDFPAGTLPFGVGTKEDDVRLLVFGKQPYKS